MSFILKVGWGEGGGGLETRLLRDTNNPTASQGLPLIGGLLECACMSSSLDVHLSSMKQRMDCTRTSGYIVSDLLA